VSGASPQAPGAQAPAPANGDPAPDAPGRDCPICPRLVDFRQKNREREPGWHNAPVPSFGLTGARLLVVGLAPGLKGANRTGRPYTGDYAGDLLYATLRKFGFAEGDYDRRPDDGFRLIGCRVTNAVRCVPPENKPTPSEIAACRPFLVAEIAAMPRLEAILALGAIAHASVLAALGERVSRRPFKHGALHELAGGRLLADSYHCSRYNTNTGRLTMEMFEAVVAALAERLAQGLVKDSASAG
jgi:uracil-DNA glycosylase family 4